MSTIHSLTLPRLLHCHIHQLSQHVSIKISGVQHVHDAFDSGRLVLFTGEPHCPLNASAFLIAHVTLCDAQTGDSVRLIDPMDTIHFHQVCCVNVFCCILRSLDLDQFHSLCTEFLLNPQVSIWFPCVACHRDRSFVLLSTKVSISTVAPQSRSMD